MKRSVFFMITWALVASVPGDNEAQDVQNQDKDPEFHEKSFQSLMKNVPKDVSENSREFAKSNDFQVLEENVLRDSTDQQRHLQKYRCRHYGNREYIAYVKVEAKTGNVVNGGKRQWHIWGANPELEIVLNNGRKSVAKLKGKKDTGERYEIELSVVSDFNPQLACTHQEDIKNVYLKARGNDGWYVESIDTYTAGRNKKYTKLTSDPGFSMWGDNNDEYAYPYNAKKHLLTNAVPGSCITYIRVDAMTGNKFLAGSRTWGKNHLIVLILTNNQELQAELEGPMEQGQPYMRELHFASRFQTTQCISLSDIKEIHLRTQNGRNNGWYTASIRTSAKTGDKQYKTMTNDPHLNKWLDANEEYWYLHSAKDIKLTWEKKIIYCEHGNSSCYCDADVHVCIFNLEIDEIKTFTSYEKLWVDEPTGLAMRGSQGVTYYFGDDGTPTPLQNRTCSTQNSTKCTYPQFVDGKTYRLAIAVNGQIPGPTLIVHEGQTVVVRVHNNLTTEGISIHWHGIHQKETPWMDGVGQVTQCQIGPQTSFSYKYTASPSGTFWYHSHSGAQRTDGLYGALIVKESKDTMAQIQSQLKNHGVYGAIKDLPDKHTLTLLDWQYEASLDLFTNIASSLGFYPNKSHGEVPTPDDENNKRYIPTASFDQGGVGPIPFFSGIINGKGRHDDVPYNKTRLSIFTVEAGKTYRFRLVGAQGLYAFRFSIDGHKLTVVGTDGYWIQPVKDVDYIIIHTGERYDFLLNATNEPKDYWIRAETLEIDESPPKAPYQSKGHVAEAILHYKRPSDSDDQDANVPSTQYKQIKDASPSVQCTQTDQCKAVNCPFQNFHPSYNITCVNVQNLRLLEPTPTDELPKANPNDSCSNCRHFINFNFEGSYQTSSVNGRNLILPSSPPQTQNEKFENNDTKCNLTVDCNPSTTACSCVHVIDIPVNETIQLVLSGIGEFDEAHPIHLHGHSFHVVHVGYPEYDNTTGFVGNHSNDIYCGDINCTKEGCNNKSCTRPSWRTEAMNFSIHDHTIRKDTVILPAGGYVVINFLSHNPGYWFLHCHIEVHQLEGMALIVNENAGPPVKPPAGMNTCGDFDFSV